MTDDELVKMLKAAQAVALIPYPFADRTVHNPHLVMALGEIIGIVDNAIHKYRNPPE